MRLTTLVVVLGTRASDQCSSSSFICSPSDLGRRVAAPAGAILNPPQPKRHLLHGGGKPAARSEAPHAARAASGGAPPRSGAARGHAPRLARALERPRRPPQRPPGGCGAGGRGGRWCERRWSGRGGCSGRRGRPRRLGRRGGAGGRPRARDGRARGFSRRGATRRGRGGGLAGCPGPGPPSERPPATLGGLGSLRAGAAPAPRGAAGIGLSRPRAQGPVPDLAARAAGPLPGAARKSCTARSSAWLSGQQSLDTPSCEWRAPAEVAGGGRGR